MTRRETLKRGKNFEAESRLVLDRAVSRTQKNPSQDDVLIIDFAYHWFKMAVQAPEQIVGPEDFLVARPTSLLKEGITYHANDDASVVIASSLNLDDYRDEVLDVFAELKRRVGVAA